MIDDHAHPFATEFHALDLESLSLDVVPGAEAASRRHALGPGRLFHHLMTVKLASLLGVTPDDAATARDQTARSDWPRWVRRLLDDAEIEGIVMDAAQGCTPPTRPTDLQTLTARPIWHIARIDPCVDALIARGASASEVLSGVESYMQQSAALGAVAFKTILAYRTGLRVDPTCDLQAAQRSLDDPQRLATPLKLQAKPLRDLVFRTMLARCADLRLPVQIHTGIGDSDIYPANSAPLLLSDILHTAEGTAATIVLIHGAFPWGQEAAYLTLNRPNVWIEMSLSNLFAPVGVTRRLLEILDIAPRGRVLMGTDGHVTPESHWFAARILAESWSQVRRELTAVGATAGWIKSTRQAIMTDNARDLYGLHEQR